MKQFHLTVFGVISFFLIIMGCVAFTALARTSGKTGHDPAQINKLRELALK